MIESGLYFHIPFCEKRCNYCSFFSSIYQKEICDQYIDEVVNEIKLFTTKNPKIYVKTIYFGGGTPSLLSLKNLEKIFNAIYSYFSVHNSEITIEVNPNSSTEIDKYGQFGINRISVGIQSTSDKLLRKIGRIHNAEEGIDCLKRASELFKNVSADIILGIDEKQDPKQEFLSIFPYVKHISAYMLTLEEGTSLWQKVQNHIENVASDDQSIDQYNEFMSIAERHGFYRYETSNFCKKGFESKHNTSYWDLTPYIGFGAGAHSYFNGMRYYNSCSIQDYIKGKHSGNGKEKIERMLSIFDDELEYIMLSLRTTKGINLSFFKNKFQIDFIEKYFNKIKKEEKYLIQSDDYICISPSYFLVQNEIIRSILY